MSVKHPIIAVTGSSGAGTTTVMKSFTHIFRREHINAQIVEGDAFHRYDRNGMREAMKRAEHDGAPNFSHFGPRGEPARRTGGALHALRRERHRAVAPLRARRRRSAALQAGWRDLHAVGGRRARYRPDVLRGAARRGRDRQGRHRASRGPADRRRADHQPRVDSEAAPRPDDARLLARSRGRHDPAAHARLRATTSARSSRART